MNNVVGVHVSKGKSMVSSQVLSTAKWRGKGHTSVRSRVLESALKDTGTLLVSKKQRRKALEPLKYPRSSDSLVWIAKFIRECFVYYLSVFARSFHCKGDHYITPKFQLHIA